MLVFASQKIVLNVRDEMAEFVVPLRKGIKDSFGRTTRQGMQKIRGLIRKGLPVVGREEKERVLPSSQPQLKQPVFVS